MKQIAILASGNGSNAEAIVHHFRATGEAEVAMIITNKPQAGVIQRAERLGVPCHYFTNAELREGTRPIALMKEHGVELIILAGYLCLITPMYIMEYPERIINIHPAPPPPSHRPRRKNSTRLNRCQKTINHHAPPASN